MKICYVIQTYKKPEQIYRLIQIIKRSSSCSTIIVSHNFKHCNFDFTPLKNLSGVKVLHAQGGRGDFSTVQRYLNAVDWLFRQNIDFDWLINLTGQDYPTQPLSQIETFLAKTSYDGFIEYFEVFSKQSHWSIHEGYSRYLYRYKQLVSDLPEWQKEILKPLKIINYVQPFFRINFSYGMTLGIRTSTPFDDKFICYGGSFFCTLSRKCVQHLHEVSKANPNLVDYYRGVCQSDELFIQTILLNSRLFNLSNDCKRYFDFSRTRNGHPRILTIHDYPSLIQDNIHFARKFDITQDSEILDILDARILKTNKHHVWK